MKKKYKCRICKKIIGIYDKYEFYEDGEEELWNHLGWHHPRKHNDCEDLDTPYMIEECYDVTEEKMTKEEAASVLNTMLYEHHCNSAWIDFNSEDDDEMEKADEWNERNEALKIAIEVLKKKKKERS